MAKPALPLDESLLDFALRKKPPVEEASFLDRGKDASIDLGRGLLGVPRGLMGLADLLPETYSPTQLGIAAFNALASKIKDPSAPLVYNSSVQTAVNKNTPLDLDALDTVLGRQYSAERQAEQQEVSRYFSEDGILSGLKAAVANPAVPIGSIIESVPSILTGRSIGSAIQGGAKFLTPVVSGALGEGVVQAGSAASGIQAETGQPLAAQQKALAATSGAGTALFSLAGGKVADKLGIGDIDVAGSVATENGKSLPRKMLEATISEGLLEELPQSMQEAVMQNLALGKPWNEGLSEAAGMGALTGGLMGAGTNLLQHYTAKVEQARQDAHQQLQAELQAQEGALLNETATSIVQGAAPVSLLDGATTPEEQAIEGKLAGLQQTAGVQAETIDAQAAQTAQALAAEDAAQQAVSPIHHEIAQRVGVDTGLFRQTVDTLYSAAKNFGEFSKGLVQQFGETIRTYAMKLWTAYKGSALASERGSFSVKPTNTSADQRLVEMNRTLNPPDEHKSAYLDLKMDIREELEDTGKKWKDLSEPERHAVLDKIETFYPELQQAKGQDAQRKQWEIEDLLDSAEMEGEAGATTSERLEQLRQTYRALPEGDLKQEVLEAGKQYAQIHQGNAPQSEAEQKAAYLDTLREATNAQESTSDKAQREKVVAKTPAPELPVDNFLFHNDERFFRDGQEVPVLPSEPFAQKNQTAPKDKQGRHSDIEIIQKTRADGSTAPETVLRQQSGQEPVQTPPVNRMATLNERRLQKIQQLREAYKTATDEETKQRILAEGKTLSQKMQNGPKKPRMQDFGDDLQGYLAAVEKQYQDSIKPVIGEAKQTKAMLDELTGKDLSETERIDLHRLRAKQVKAAALLEETKTKAATRAVRTAEREQTRLERRQNRLIGKMEKALRSGEEVSFETLDALDAVTELLEESLEDRTDRHHAEMLSELEKEEADLFNEETADLSSEDSDDLFVQQVAARRRGYRDAQESPSVRLAYGQHLAPELSTEEHDHPDRKRFDYLRRDASNTEEDFEAYDDKQQEALSDAYEQMLGSPALTEQSPAHDSTESTTIATTILQILTDLAPRYDVRKVVQAMLRSEGLNTLRKLTTIPEFLTDLMEYDERLPDEGGVDPFDAPAEPDTRFFGEDLQADDEVPGAPDPRVIANAKKLQPKVDKISAPEQPLQDDREDLRHPPTREFLAKRAAQQKARATRIKQQYALFRLRSEPYLDRHGNIKEADLSEATLNRLASENVHAFLDAVYALALEGLKTKAHLLDFNRIKGRMLKSDKASPEFRYAASDKKLVRDYNDPLPMAVIKRLWLNSELIAGWNQGRNFDPDNMDALAENIDQVHAAGMLHANPDDGDVPLFMQPKEWDIRNKEPIVNMSGAMQADGTRHDTSPMFWVQTQKPDGSWSSPVPMNKIDIDQMQKTNQPIRQVSDKPLLPGEALQIFAWTQDNTRQNIMQTVAERGLMIGKEPMTWKRYLRNEARHRLINALKSKGEKRTAAQTDALKRYEGEALMMEVAAKAALLKQQMSESMIADPDYFEKLAAKKVWKDAGVTAEQMYDLFLSTGKSIGLFQAALEQKRQEVREVKAVEAYNNALAELAKIKTNPTVAEIEKKAQEYLRKSVNFGEKWDAYEQFLKGEQQDHPSRRMFEAYRDYETAVLNMVRKDATVSLLSKEQAAADQTKYQNNLERSLSLATQKAERGLQVEKRDYFSPKTNLSLTAFERELMLRNEGLQVGHFNLSSMMQGIMGSKGLFENVLDKIAKIFGADLVLVDAPNYRSRYIGKASDGRPKIVLNARLGKLAMPRVFAHEVFHHVVNKLTKGEYLAFRNALQHMLANPGKYGSEIAGRFMDEVYESGMNANGPDQVKIKILEQAITRTAIREKLDYQAAEEEVMAELFADVAMDKEFYAFLSQSLPGRTLGAKIIKALLPQIGKFLDLHKKQRGFSFERDMLVNKSDMQQVYGLVSEILGLSIDPDRIVRSSAEKFLTAAQTWSVATHALQGPFKALFPRGSVSWRHITNTLQSFVENMVDWAKGLKPSAFHADLWADPKQAKLAYKVAHAGNYLRDQLHRTFISKHKDAFKGMSKEGLEKVFDAFCRGLVVTKTSDPKKLAAYEQQVSRLKVAKATKAITKKQFRKQMLTAYQTIVTKTPVNLDVGTPNNPNQAGIAMATQLGFSDEIITVFQQYKQYADLMYAKLKKLYPDLKHNPTHFGQSIQWYRTDGTVLDEGFDWAVNPEFSKLEGRKQFLKDRDMSRSTEEIAISEGLEYRSIDPHDMFLTYMRDAQRLVALHEALQEGIEQKLVKGFYGEHSDLQAAEEGFVPVDDNALKVLAKLKLPETYRIRQANGETFKDGEHEAVFSSVEEAQRFIAKRQNNPAFTGAKIYSGKSLSVQSEPLWKVSITAPDGTRLDYDQTFKSQAHAQEFAAKKEAATGVPHNVTSETVGAAQAQVGQFYMRKDLANMLNVLLAKDPLRNGKLLGISGQKVMGIKNAMTSVEFALSMFHMMTIGQELVSSAAGHALQRYQGSERVGKFIRAFNPAASFKEANQLTTLLTAIVENENLASDPAVLKKAEELLGTRNLDLLDLVKTYYDGVGGMLHLDEGLQSPVHSYGNMRYTSKDDKINIVNGEVQFERGIVSDLSLKAMKASFSEVWDNELAMSGNKLKALSKTTLFSLLEAPTAFLMEYGIPRVKMAMWAKEYTLELDRQKDKLASGAVTKDQIARDVMFFVEDRFGEVNWKNMWMKPSVKTTLQFFFRSFTWMAGSWVALGKAGVDMTKWGWFKMKGEDYQLTTKGYWGITAVMSHMLTVGLVTAAYAAMGAASGAEEVEDDEDTPLLTKMLFPRISFDNPQERITVPSYVTELYKIMRHTGVVGNERELAKLVTGRFNSIIGRTVEVLQGEDWRGVSITNHDDSFATKTLKQAVHMALVLPISLSTVKRSLENKGLNVKGLAVGLAGFTDAPASAKRSDAANKAFEIRRRENKGREISEDEAELSQDIKRAVYQYAHGDKSAVQAMLKEGRLSRTKLNNALTKLPRINGKKNPRYRDPLSQAVKGMTLGGALEVWTYMTDTEKNTQRRLITQKYFNMMKRQDRSPAEKTNYRKRMKELGILK